MDKFQADVFDESLVSGFIPDISSYQTWIEGVCVSHRKILDSVFVVWCSDEHLLEVNRTHLNHDYYTDIITFDSSFSNRVSGELYISVDRVLDHAEERGLNKFEELDRVVIHGVLHLCGYGDKTDKEASVMRKLEDEALNLRARFHVEHGEI